MTDYKTNTDQKTVEYFSHPWKDVDLFATWRENTKQNETSNGRRLENLTWRRFFQQKFHLPKLSPSQLDWQKSSDSLWLYGPFFEDGNGGTKQDLSISSNTNSLKSKKKRILKRKSDPTHDIPSLAGANSGGGRYIMGPPLLLHKNNAATETGGISF